jgi:glycosyltransferase involved in cell wall biosynthesis
MKLLSIVIPVFNEEKTINQVLTLVTEKKISDWKKEIIVVDDGSKDNTRSLLKAWEKKVKVIYSEKNQGKGAAVRKGFDIASGEVVLIQDADMEYTPDDYENLLKPFDNPRVQAVYGSRFLGSHLSTMLLYAWGNKFVTLLTNIIYNSNITDMETGYKLFRRSLLSGMVLKAKSFDFEPEFTAKILKRGYQIYEVPISYYGRKFEEGKKLTWRDGIAAVTTLLKYRFSE